MRCIELKGQKFGFLLVVERTFDAKRNETTWLCRCDCGNEVKVNSHRLTHGIRKSCGCLKANGRNVASRRLASDSRQFVAQNCAESSPRFGGRCALKGCEEPVRSVGFCAHHYDMWHRHGHPLAAELQGYVKSNRPRGKERKIWNGIKSRCRNPRTPGYRNYGAMGINICEEWFASFEKFFADMGPCPAGFSIDRIDFNKGYEPHNCRWADTRQQSRNTRSTILSVDLVAQARGRALNGEAIANIARSFGVGYSVVYQAVRGRSWAEVEPMVYGN